jgi:ABC-type polysaccharide/polyol phosphate transport system ATPase subunit
VSGEYLLGEIFLVQRRHVKMDESIKQTRLKKGRTYLIWSVILLGINFALYSANISGLIGALGSGAMFVLFIGGLGYLVAGLVTKE